MLIQIIPDVAGSRVMSGWFNPEIRSGFPIEEMGHDARQSA
jgi:hypothetical protein